MVCACWNELKCLAYCCGCVKQRYVLSSMCGLALLNAYTMRLCLNIAITVMARPVAMTGNATVLPGTCPGDVKVANATAMVAGEFSWSQSEQGYLLGSFFWLYWLSHIPGGIIAERWGGKPLLLISILCTAVLTILTPVAVRVGGLYTLIAVRVLEGILEGPAYPAANVLMAHWSPATEKCFHSSIAFSGVIIGSVIAHALSGVLLHATDNAWDLIFYVFGAAAIVWCLLFWLFCSNHPWDHPFISQAELDFLDKELKNVAHGGGKLPVPWRSIATSVPLLALVIAHMGHDWIFFALITDLPKYMKDVLHFKILQLGFYASIPYLCEWVVALVSGRLADLVVERNWIKTINVRRVLGTTSSVLPAMAIVAASLAECNLALVMTCFTLSLTVMGTFYPGVKVNALDLSPNHAGVLMGLVNGLAALSGVIVPVLIGHITPNSTLLEWRVAFIIIAVVTFFCNVVYCTLGSADVQSWNEPPPEST